MKALRIVLSTWLVLILLGASTPAAPSREQIESAGKAAQAWLALADAGKYDESWENAAGFAKGLVDKKQWVDNLSLVRHPLGRVLSRTLTDVEYRTTLPGAPEGEYVVIQYVTIFETKPGAVETVTPMLDKDGKWRVSGYYIR